MNNRIVSIIILVFICLFVQAQRANDNDIQDSVIGWWGNNHFDHLKPQTDVLGKKKEAIVNDMVKWMKTSYTPVGGLGTSSRYINKNGYGVSFLVWNVSHDKQWTEPNGKFKPIPEENTQFIMAANHLFGAFPIDFINKSNHFYFTMQPNGYADNQQMADLRKGADPRIYPNVYNYTTWVNDWTTVYLAPNNKLPFVPVTKGELLQRAEEGLQNVLADRLEQVQAQWPNSKKSQDEAMEYNKKEIEKYRNNIKTLREKYSSTLNEPAVIRDMQVTMYSFINDPDLFKIDPSEKELNHGYPVYKLDDATRAKLNSDVPQWVAVGWPFENKNRGNQLYEMYTALAQNINYDYIYNYFFAPEKVTGKPYTAADAAGLKTRLDAYRNTNAKAQITAAKKKDALPKGVLLFDDFSQDVLGGKPSGWYIRSYGKAYTVAMIDGEKGQWMKLGYNNKTYPTALKMPLPENFTIEYDLATGEFNDRWGATLEMNLQTNNRDKNGSQSGGSFNMKITAGNGNSLDHDYRGEVRVNLSQWPSKLAYNDMGGEYVYVLKEFNSNKRKVHIALVKDGDEITVIINNQQSFSTKDYKSKYGKPCGECAFPAGFRFSELTFQSLTQDPDNVGCYISNVKISQN